LFLVFRNLADGIRWILPALVVHQTTGLPFEASVIVLAGATALYAVVGGVSSVIWNGCAQFVVYMLGALLTLWVVANRLPGGFAEIFSFAASTGRDQWLDPALGLTGTTITIWSGVIGGATLSFASHGVDHLMVQRYLCARDERQAAWALKASGPVILVQFALFLLIGVGLAALQTASGKSPADTLGDEAFLKFITTGLPVGLAGLLVAAVLAAAMSTSFNASAGVVVKDLIEPLRGPLSPIDGMRVSRVATVVMAVVQTIVASAM
jgi:Na+/proline symporter